MDRPTSLFAKLSYLFVAVCLLSMPTRIGHAQVDGTEFETEIPASYSGSGSFFNRELGTAFRFGYHSEGYGTQAGVVTLGSMKVFNWEGSTLLFDGQATLSDEFGGGYNAGVAYRSLGDIGFGPDPRRIHGVGFWSDGQSTSADNFFNQLGVTLESLGDLYDLRFQGNFPLERIKDGDRRTVAGAGPLFEGDALLAALQRFERDTALTVVDLEGARRLMDLEAWAFLAGYHLTGSGLDATGYRAGVRGYAVPDLAVTLQVTDDDIYQTNVMFGLTWFVGRTHRCNQPCGTLLDRFREPVLRNDFIATVQETIDDPMTPLTDAVTNEQFVFVHVDSSAPAGGDGTFENPYQTMAAAEAGSGEDNIIFVHSGSTDPAVSFAAQNGQRILGEGLDPNGIFIDHTVNTAEQGIVSLPETSPGSQDFSAPTLFGVGTVFELADNNEINNFTINGGTTAVSGNGVTAPQLANLDINGPLTDGVVFTDVEGNSLIANSVSITGTTGRGIAIIGGSGVVGANAMVMNAGGRSVVVTGREGGSVTFGEIDDDFEGILLADNTGGNITFSSLADLDTGTDDSVTLHNNSGATITFQELQATATSGNTFVVRGGGTISVNNAQGDEGSDIINTGTGDALVVTGDDVDPNVMGNSVLTILGDVTNEGGGQVAHIQQMAGGSVSVTGEVTDADGTGMGIRIENNTAGTFSFAGATMLDTGDNSAVFMKNNTGTTTTFGDLHATAAAGDTFVVTGGGTINVNDPNDNAMIANTGAGSALVVRGADDPNADGNPVLTVLADINNSGGGQAVDIQDMTGGTVSITGDVNDVDSAGMGILLQNNTGGTFSFAGATTLDTGGNNAVTLTDNDGAAVTFSNLMATAADGNTFDIQGGGTITVNDPNDDGFITNTGTGTAFKVSGDGMNDGDPSVTIAVDITNTGGGRAVDIRDMTGGIVSLNGTVDDTDGGIFVSTNSSGADINFNALVTANNGVDDAVELMNNTGADISFSGLDITVSGAGKGFTATSGGNLSVSNTNGTSITQNGTGTALELQDMTIAAGGVTFDTVDVGGGTADSIVLRNLDGTGLVTVGSGTDPNDGGTITTSATAMEVDNVNNLAVRNIRIDNPTGHGIDVSNQGVGSAASFTGLNVDTTTGTGVNIQENSAGIVTFNGLTVASTTGNAVVHTDNSGATVSYTELTASAVGGNTFSVQGGGSINVNDSGDGSTITNTGAGTALFVQGNLNDPNSMTNFFGDPNVTIASDITNGGGGLAASIRRMSGGSVTISGDVDDPNGNGGILIEENTGGVINFAASTMVNATGTNNALTHTNNSGASVTYSELTATAEDGNAFAVQGGGSIRVNDGGTGSTITATGSGTALFVQGNQNDPVLMTNFVGDPNVTIAADITNQDTGQAARIRRMNGGRVTVSGDVSDPNGSGNGILIEENPNGTVNFNGMVTLNTGTNDALTIQDNGAGNTVNFNAASQLDIDTTSGTGIVIHDTGTVTIGGIGNTVDSTTDVGIDVSNARDATINNTTVNAAGDNAINIAHDNSLTSEVELNSFTVASAGGIGANIDPNGSGEFDIRMNNVDIGSVGQEGILLDTGNNADRVDFTITNSNVTAGDDEAFLATLNDSDTANVRFLIEQNQFSNNSGTAGSNSATVDIRVNSGMTLNATIGNGPVDPNNPLDPPPPAAPIGEDNRFVNSSADGDAFLIEIDDGLLLSDGTLNLDLRDNTAQSGDVQFGLTQTDGIFNLVDATDTINGDNNQGTVTDAGTINNFAPPLLMPTP